MGQCYLAMYGLKKDIQHHGLHQPSPCLQIALPPSLSRDKTRGSKIQVGLQWTVSLVIAKVCFPQGYCGHVWTSLHTLSSQRGLNLRSTPYEYSCEAARKLIFHLQV